MVQLKDHNGVPLDTGTASYYAAGWHYGYTTSGGQVSIEMLPGSYSFAMTFNGTRQQLSYLNISSINPVVFQTELVTVQLKDHNGAPLDTGTASYYAAGWHYGYTTSGGQVSIEMLPGSYSFGMVYNGTHTQLNGQSTGNPVVFQTGQVVSGTGTATSYYAGGWQSFASPEELLPGKWWFDFSDAEPNTQVTVTAGNVTNIH